MYIIHSCTYSYKFRNFEKFSSKMLCLTYSQENMPNTCILSIFICIMYKYVQRNIRKTQQFNVQHLHSMKSNPSQFHIAYCGVNYYCG